MSGLSRLRNMFRVSDLRNKIFFTIFIIFDLPDRVVRPCSVRRLPRDPGAEEEHRHRRARLPRPVLGRRAHGRGRVRARDHAVHHVVDHHAVARRRDPEARRVAERRPDRAEEDHAVDPLPHGRARADAVDRARVRAEERQGRPARPVVHAAPRGHGAHPQLHRVQSRAHHPHLDGRYRARHVAR